MYLFGVFCVFSLPYSCFQSCLLYFVNAQPGTCRCHRCYETQKVFPNFHNKHEQETGSSLHFNQLLRSVEQTPSKKVELLGRCMYANCSKVYNSSGSENGST